MNNKIMLLIGIALILTVGLVSVIAQVGIPSDEVLSIDGPLTETLMDAGITSLTVGEVSCLQDTCKFQVSFNNPTIGNRTMLFHFNEGDNIEELRNERLSRELVSVASQIQNQIPKGQFVTTVPQQVITLTPLTPPIEPPEDPPEVPIE